MSFDMFPDSAIKYLEENAVAKKNKSDKCTVCGNKIETQIMKNSGVCGELCRKARDGETIGPHYAQTDAGITNMLKTPNQVNPNGIR